MDVILDKAEWLGMQVWILDDAHFPTGYANGRVKSAPDDLKQWYLKHQELDFTGPVDSGWVAVSRNGKMHAVLFLRKKSWKQLFWSNVPARMTLAQKAL